MVLPDQVGVNGGGYLTGRRLGQLLEEGSGNPRLATKIRYQPRLATWDPTAWAVVRRKR